ncbi:MAG TPA: RDD family protein [Burkholderiales bacterium]|nr:RDD family protein [Burkholderiales bacterium]
MVASPAFSVQECAPQTAGLLRRILSMLYEALLLFAVWWAAGFLFLAVTPGMSAPWVRAAFQIYLVSVAAAYYVWCWLRGGQTLAMKTWRVRLISTSGNPVTLKQALLRFAVAAAGICLAGAGIIWAFFDSEGQFLHDRLAGTKIVRC